MIILFWQVLISNWKRTTNEIAVSALSLEAAHSGLAKLIHSTAAFSLD